MNMELPGLLVISLWFVYVTIYCMFWEHAWHGLCLFFPIREQKEKSEMKRGSRIGRKGKARPPKPNATTVSFSETMLRKRLQVGGAPWGNRQKEVYYLEKYKYGRHGLLSTSSAVRVTVPVRSKESHMSTLRSKGLCNIKTDILQQGVRTQAPPSVLTLSIHWGMGGLGESWKLCLHLWYLESLVGESHELLLRQGW